MVRPFGEPITIIAEGVTKLPENIKLITPEPGKFAIQAQNDNLSMTMSISNNGSRNGELEVTFIRMKKGEWHQDIASTSISLELQQQIGLDVNDSDILTEFATTYGSRFVSLPKIEHLDPKQLPKFVFPDFIELEEEIKAKRISARNKTN